MEEKHEIRKLRRKFTAEQKSAILKDIERCKTIKEESAARARCGAFRVARHEQQPDKRVQRRIGC